MSQANPSAEAATSFVRVGKVKDAHGIRGELFIVLFSGEAAWLEKLKEIQLVKENGKENSQEEPRRFSVKSARLHKNGLIVKSGDIKDRNEAETLKGLLLEIPQSFLVSEPGETIYLSEVKGFKVITQAKGDVGKIIAFTHNGAQDLLVVATADGEFEIPFVDAFVEKIDYEAGIVLMNLPEGLLGELDAADTEGDSEAESAGRSGSAEDPEETEESND